MQCCCGCRCRLRVLAQCCRTLTAVVPAALAAGCCYTGYLRGTPVTEGPHKQIQGGLRHLLQAAVTPRCCLHNSTQHGPGWSQCARSVPTTGSSSNRHQQRYRNIRDTTAALAVGARSALLHVCLRHPPQPAAAAACPSAVAAAPAACTAPAVPAAAAGTAVGAPAVRGLPLPGSCCRHRPAGSAGSIGAAQADCRVCGSAAAGTCMHSSSTRHVSSVKRSCQNKVNHTNKNIVVASIASMLFGWLERQCVPTHTPVAHGRLDVTARLLAGVWDVWLPAVMAGL